MDNSIELRSLGTNQFVDDEEREAVPSAAEQSSLTLIHFVFCERDGLARERPTWPFAVPGLALNR